MDVSFDGGKTLRLLIDFSGDSSYITLDGAIKAGLVDAYATTGTESEVTAPVTHRKSIKIGSTTLEEQFTISNPKNLFSLYSRGEAPAIEGSLSYRIFVDHVVVLDMPHHQLLIAKSEHKLSTCKACQHLDEVSQDFSGKILVTYAFVLDGQQATVVIDPLFKGAVLAVEPIRGIPTSLVGQQKGTYRGDGIFFVKNISVKFGNHTLAGDAPLLRTKDSFGVIGRPYDAVIGLSLLSQYEFSFDFRNMTLELTDATRSSL